MQTVNQIRSAFLEFFKSKDHEVVQSSGLIPHNDPTLMFINAGMVPFKDVFTQNEKRNYVRAASSQKCVRAGGKHNDLDNVGYTARHHTFFEMLGNFSFGDYFKEDAIKNAWEFLTEVIKLPKEKLSVTVYHTDDEAYDIWKRVANLPDEKILRVPTNDNFWSMGDTGPCGPCSEIFYDHGDSIEGEWKLDADGNDLFEDRFIEIWNLVFMQYEQFADGSRIDLPAPSIDTGMGLERLAAVLQDVHNNYDIDLFENLKKDALKVLGLDNSTFEKSALAAWGSYPIDGSSASLNVIADHLRSMCFLLADGVMPSNEGRGYVLRRIMRRAMRHAKNLGCDKPVIYKLVPSLVREMGEAYPELSRAQGLVTEIIKLEEERFGETLGRGLKLLEEAAQNLKSGDVLDGEIAFKLYDTYGFPYDLTVDILRNREITVDESAFNAAMAEQKERAKAAWKGSGDQATSQVWFEVKEEFGATEFFYDSTKAQGVVQAIVKNGEVVESAKVGDEVTLVLNQTPFYGESGGQMGDTGVIESEDAKISVSDTQKALGALHTHSCKIESGQINKNDTVTAIVDNVRCDKIRANHSATHILHAVLRDVLGEHVTQKGSLVAQDKLRFDVANPKAITKEQLQIVEQKVNDIVRQNSELFTKIMAPEDAIKAGAMALFGEKYGDEVRVVSMGEGYSVELCGGTHVKRTGDIGLFKIVSEGAVAAGIRRIEALTGQEAINFCNKNEETLQNVAANLKVSVDDVNLRIEALLEERKKLEKELAKAKKDLAMGGSGGGDVAKEEIGGVAFIGKNFGDVPPKDLRNIATDLQKQIGSGVVAVGSSFDGKGSIIIAVTDDLTAKFSAVDLVRTTTEALGAKGGGGKPNFAQTGGTNGAGVDDAINNVKAKLAG